MAKLVALVTGAGGRIGAAIARALGSHGYAVVVHYRGSRDGAEEVVADVVAAGGQAVSQRADLARRGERSKLISRAAKAFGPLTVLVNNASIYRPDAATDLDETLWDSHFAIHVEAPVFLARDFAAQLPDGAIGNIINLIDERVLNLSPAYFSYTLSKSALWTATRTLAQSLAPRIRVNAIGPGPTIEEAGHHKRTLTQAWSRLPLKRGATPDEVAAAIRFILESPSMTGQMLALDGGQHLEWNLRRSVTPAK